MDLVQANRNIECLIDWIEEQKAMEKQFPSDNKIIVDLDEDIREGVSGSNAECFDPWEDEVIYEYNQNWQQVLDQEYEEMKALCGMC